MKNIVRTLLLMLTLAAASARADYPQLPDFKLPTDNGEVSQSTFKDQVVYIDFWASWCKPCLKSFPFLNELQQRYGSKGLKILAINLDKDHQAAESFLHRTPASFTVAFDEQGDIAQRFHVQGMPSSYLVDRKGYIRARHIGFRDEDKAKLEQAVASLLKE